MKQVFLKSKKIFSQTGGGGTSNIDSINAGTNISIDNTDPKNPIINSTVKTPIEVANYSALPPVGTSPGQMYIVLASQGTKWLPGSLGGTYYPKGYYYDATSQYIYSETPYQATQSEVDTGTNTDKFVTPDTFTNASKWNTKKDSRVYYISVLNPFDNIIYYFNEIWSAGQNNLLNRPFKFLSGTKITGAILNIIQATNGTSENSTFGLYNITTNTYIPIGTFKCDFGGPAIKLYEYTGLNITINTNDSYSMYIQAATFATNPTSQVYAATLNIQ